MYLFAVVPGIAVLAFLGVTAGPLLVADRRYELRDPDRDERTVIKTYQESAGLEIDRIAVIESSRIRSIQVSVRGLPGRRVLFVSETVLEDLEDSTITALFAAEAGRVQTYYTEFRGLAVGVVLGILGATVLTLVPFGPGFVALALIGFVSFWVGRRVQYAADDHAADYVGPDPLAEAFQRAAELRGVEPKTGSWQTLFEVQPPLGDRISRLRDRAD